MLVVELELSAKKKKSSLIPVFAKKHYLCFITGKPCKIVSCRFLPKFSFTSFKQKRKMNLLLMLGNCKTFEVIA